MNSKLEAAKAKLFDLISGGADLSSICTCIADFVGNPVDFTLPTRTIIAHSDNFTKDLVDEYLNAGRLMTDEEYEAMENEFNKTFGTGKAGVYLWGFSLFKRMGCGCLYKKRLVAVLDCPLVNALPNEEQREIFEAAAAMLVVVMKERGMLRGSEQHPMQEFLTELLNGNINMAYQWTFRRNFILNDSSRFRVAWIASLDETTNADTTLTQLYDFCSLRKNWWCVPREEGYALLLDAADDGSMSKLSENLGEKFVICVSDVFSDLRELSSNLSLCRMALKYSSSNLQTGRQVVYVDDFKPLIAYFYAYANSGFDIFKSNTIERIKEYDTKYGTAYLETLRVCIHYNQDTDDMARRLHLHKNTVFYRLRQLRDLFGVDLKDIRQLTNFYLALCMEYHTYKRKQQSGTAPV